MTYKHKRPWVVVAPSLWSDFSYQVLWAPVVRVTREQVISRHETYAEATAKVAELNAEEEVIEQRIAEMDERAGVNDAETA